MWQKTLASGAVALTAALIVTTAMAADMIRAVPVDADGPLKDPDAAFWEGIESVRVPLQPQMVVPPRHLQPAVTEISARAAHNGQWIGVLIEWPSAGPRDTIVSDTFGDQVAVQFPVQGEVQSSPMMGHAGAQVNILQWRAALQRDLAKGEPDIRDLYPYALVDVYPDEVLRLTDARAYTGALGLDNPVARPFESPVLDQMAEGWGTLTVRPLQMADGWGVWEDGTWRVAITRPMRYLSPGDPDRLTPGNTSRVAFAVWDGNNNEVGARKSWSNWTPLRIEEWPMSIEPNAVMDEKVGDILTRAHRFQTLAALFSYPDSGGYEALCRSLESLGRAGRGVRGAAERDAIDAVATAWRQADAALLQAEYGRLFLGRTPCSLHSAAYSGAGSLAGPAAEIADISGFYQAFGVDIRDDQPERPDHLAAELEFYGTLLIKLAYAQLSDWVEASDVTAAAARSFLSDHLGRWSGVLSERLQRNDAAAPFRTLAAWLDRLLDDECQRFGVKAEPFGEPITDSESADSMICPHDGAAVPTGQAQPVHFHRARH
ncbi:nitrate reductase subunit, conjectural [Thioalkalivibrio nitratireducens DSM 14787]|uniref:Nitrate reductase subunit, conjectural n=1 Tax=Thioalkalivibrio nitratireducens (strain DSM 14787 / UNIQEM 213 / ALEN2) TaxID=1255043 RepID=L0DUX9_THIND|nr:ethylbenzene dehydrogenase-related protein [Thioalkalivibrio nitratireducens]AGA32800.1 nitrate reductase subunit, conjectural [Thioalkalivibrio nitratireducens DSM 14787]